MQRKPVQIDKPLHPFQNCSFTTLNQKEQLLYRQSIKQSQHK